MKNKRTILSVIVASVLLTATFVSLPVVVNAGMPKIVMGWVEQNSTYGVRAWDATQNGDTVFYLQNYMSNGTSTDIMYENFSAGTTDYYSWDAGNDINWNPGNLGDLGVIIINREDGSGATRAGYVGYTADPITDSNQLFPICELQKIPVPTMVMNGTDFINVTWSALPDPLGLIAGYKIYNSTDNVTWNLAGGSTNAPLTDLYFNNTGLSPGIYYYSVKVVFKGYDNDDVAQVNNYQNAYNGEGSGPMNPVMAPMIVDSIMIVDTPNTGGVEILDHTVNVMETEWGYAAGFNSTFSTYLNDVSVTWTVVNVGSSATTAPAVGTSSQFDAGSTGGTATWTAEYAPGITDTVVKTINPPQVDSIMIVDTGSSGGAEILDQTVDVGFTILGYAAGFNSTLGTYVMDVSVTWTVVNVGSAATTAPGSGTSSTFDADGVGGTATWTATYAPGITDTVVFTINPPQVDSIMIVDTATIGGAEIVDQTVSIGFTIWGYAAGFNSTLGTYLNDVSVTWTVVNVGSVASTAPGSGTGSQFDAGGSAGTATWTAEYTPTITDTVVFTIVTEIIDQIVIVDTPNIGSTEIMDQPVDVGFTILGYAAGFNSTTTNYLGDVVVTWTVVNVGSSATTAPGSGTSSTFDADGVGGTATWTAEYAPGITDTVVFTINPPQVDSIMIVENMGTGTGEILDQTVDVGFTIMGYAAGFNSTLGTYLNDVSVTWTVVNVGSSATTAPGSGMSSTFDADGAGGTATWTAEYAPGITDTVVFTINPPQVDSIMIVDTGSSGAAEILDQTVDVGFTIMGYAAGFNSTLGTYLNDVSVTWTVVNVGSAATTAPGSGTSSTFDADGVGGTATWTAEYAPGITDTVVFTIGPPEVDSIMIVNTPNTGTGEILDQTVDIRFTILGYAAGFNSTLGTYLNDVSVTWTVVNVGSSATTAPGSGTSSTFDADDFGGTATWTAEYAPGITDTVVFTINPPEVDQIIIMDAAGGTGNPIWVNYPFQEFSLFSVSDTYTYWAAGFNLTTGNYVQDVSVYWNTTDILLNPDTNNGTVVLGPSTSTTFTANSDHGGALFVVAENAGLGLYNKTDMIIIIPPMPDEIEIRDAPNRGGNIVTTRNFNVGQSDIFYAAGINYTAGYIGDVWVNWTSSAPGIGSVVLGPSDSTTFNAVSAGTCTVTATNDTWGSSNVTGTLTISAVGPTVSYITIRDAAGGLGNEVTDRTYSVEDIDNFYVAAYTAGDVYLYDVEVEWSITPSGVGDIDTTIGLRTNFTALEVSTDSTCTVTATYSSFTDSTGTLTVLEPVVDYIQIRDASGGLGSIVNDRTYSVDQEDTFYAAACNGTIGYLFDVSVSWVSDTETVGEVTPTGASTTFEAQQVDMDSTCNVTATYGTITNMTGVLTVLEPRVDEIRIRDAPDAGGFPLTLEILSVGDTATYYAAGYNDTVGYLEDLADAVWSVTVNIGTVTSPGASTTFAATTAGQGTITASYTYDSVTITEESGTIYVNPVNLRPDPPGEPDLNVKGTDKIEISWPANTEEDLLGYYIQRSTDPDDNQSWEDIAFVDKNTTSFTDKDLDPDTKYSYRIVAVDDTFQQSDPSPVISATTEPEAFPWILLLLPIIIAIIVILLALLLWRKKKKEEEAKLPPEGAIPAAAPPEEAPPAEAPEEEYEYAPEEEYEEAPAEEYEEYEEAPSEEYEEETFEEGPEEETPTPPPPPPPPPE